MPLLVLLALIDRMSTTLSVMGSNNCSITKFHNATKLDCTSRGFKVIPQNMPLNASHIILKHNKLTSIPAFAFSNMMDIQYLDLSHNKLKQLNNESFSNMKRLLFLDLSGNYLSINYASFPVRSLHDLTSLQTLLLKTQFQYTKTAGSLVDETMKDLINLQKLSITPQLPKNECVLLGPGYEKLHKLDELELSGWSCNLNTICEGTFNALQYSSLRSLSITNCNLTHLELGSLRQLNGLKSLNLACNSDLSFHEVIAVLKNTSDILCSSSSHS